MCGIYATISLISTQMNTFDLVLTSLLFFARSVFVRACSLWDVLCRLRSEEPVDCDSPDLPIVSILIPAYNEGRVIRATVESALQSDYPNLEIIIIDDGSTDDTYDISSLLATEDDRITVIGQKPNQGKAAALNAGRKRASGDVLVTIDADTVVSEDCVRYLVSPILRSKADAVSSNIKVGNRVGSLQQLQSIEHVTGFNFDRRAQSTLRTITCIPGAAGAFRKSSINQVGGYSSETSVEDTDLTISLLRAGFRIGFEPRALAYTESPATLEALIHQRTRWENGNIHCVWKHRHAFYQCKSLGWYGMPNMLFSHILIHPLAVYIIFFSSMPSLFQVRTWVFLIAPMLMLDMLMTMFALWIDGESLSDARHLPILRLTFPFFAFFIVCRVTVRAFKRQSVSWNKLARTGELADAVISGQKAIILKEKVKQAI